MVNLHQQNALERIANLMDSNKHSDLVIKCNGREWNVHKAIVCAASEAIAKEVDSPMLEGESNVIEHEEFDADTVNRMISYIYKQTYEIDGEKELFDHKSDSTKSADEDRDEVDSQVATEINGILVAHVEAYGIGDYYHIPTLKTYAMERFTSATKVGVHIDSLIDVIKTVNHRTHPDDRALRDILREYAMTHREVLIGNAAFMDELSQLGDIQDFAVDMFRHVVRQQLCDKDEHAQSLLAKEHEIDKKEALISEMQDTEKRLRAQMDAENRAAGERFEHVNGVMDDLIDSFGSLPNACKNNLCDETFGSNLSFERKGHAKYGAGEGNWMVRCSRCKCRLIR